MGAGAKKARAMPMQRPRRQVDLERASAAGEVAGAYRPGVLQQRASVQGRGWSNVPLLGMFIEPFLNFFFPKRRFRTGAKRRSLGSGAGHMVGVKLDLIKSAERPSYLRPGERAPVTAAKGHQLARRGKVAGVLKRKAV